MLSEISTLELINEQIDVINSYIEKFPITTEEIKKHFSMLNTKEHVCTKLVKTSSPAPRMVPPLSNATPAMTAFRTSLPTFSYRSKILEAIESHDVTIITGGTGCGKTTQVPQFIIENAHAKKQAVRIFCTQPRRLSTIAISKRVAQERGEPLGSTVGYHIRLEQKISSDTVIVYCTSGVLLRMMTSDDIASDITHDEVHEREQNTDYLLIVLKRALQKRKDLKVILMSATMEDNLELFKNYFDSETAHINIPSKLFHVEKFYLADVIAMTDYFSEISRAIATNKTQNPSKARYERSLSNFGSFGFQQGNRNQLKDALKHLRCVLPNRPKSFDPCFIGMLRNSRVRRKPLVDLYVSVNGCKFSESVDNYLVCRMIIYLIDSPVAGAILVFLPGYDDIIAVNDRLACMLRKEANTKATIFMLHSQINLGDQQSVFGSVPRNHRKVILSTNIAEASLTINDVVFVIDCGKVKEKSYDHCTRINQLRMQWIAKSNAEQRSGRAGRCQHGYCFRLYSNTDYENFLETQVPEMRRSAIHDVCLHAKIFAPENMPVKQFLQMAPEPPAPDAVKQSLDFLEQLGALHMYKRESRIPFSYMMRFSRLRSSLPEPDLTYLGRAMVYLPVDPQLSRLLLFGVFLQCFDPIVTLVAVLSYRDPFVLPVDEKNRNVALDARDEFARHDFSDHLMLIRAFNAYTLSTNRQHDFCNKKFLSNDAMRLIYGIRKQLVVELKRQNLLPRGVYTHDHPKVNRFRDCWPMIQAAIVTGCYPGIGVVKDGARMRKIIINIGQAQLHPSCVLRRQLHYQTPNGDSGRISSPRIELIAYQELSLVSQRVTIKTTTLVPALTAFLFSGPLEVTKEYVDLFGIVCYPNKPVSNVLKKASSAVEPSKPAVFLNPWYELISSETRVAQETPTSAFANVSLSGNIDDKDNRKASSGALTKHTEDDLSGSESDSSYSSSSSLSLSTMVFEVNIDGFLAFNMPMYSAQAAMRLRFKLISYFLAMIKYPSRYMNKPDNALLDCLAAVLTLEHKSKAFSVSVI